MQRESATMQAPKQLGRLWRFVRARGEAPAGVETPSILADHATDVLPPLDIAPDDPILAHLQHSTGVVEIDRIRLDSPALRTMQGAGVKLVVPLISQGELVGLIKLGPRLSEQDYNSDDRRLLENLAGQAAPALQVARLVP